MHTSFFDAHKLRLIQAPMAGSQNHLLAAAVFKAGGIGSIPAAMLTPEQLQNELGAFRNAVAADPCQTAAWSDKLPVNVNFFCHKPPDAQTETEAAWRSALAPAYQSHNIDATTVGSGPGRAPFSAESLSLLGQFKPAIVSFHFGLPKPNGLRNSRLGDCKYGHPPPPCKRRNGLNNTVPTPSLPKALKPVAIVACFSQKT